jgi:hypothetical protein
LKSSASIEEAKPLSRIIKDFNRFECGDFFDMEQLAWL